MKKLLLLLVVAAAAVAVYYMTRKDSPLEMAKTAEVTGDRGTALENYVGALLEKTRSRDLPDKNRAKVLKPVDWHGEVEAYLQWVEENEAPPRDPGIDAAMEGIARCTSGVAGQILYTNDTVSVLPVESYEDAWRRAFFPSNLAVEGNHGDLVSRAVRDSVSMLCLRSVRDFSYHLRLLNVATMRRTDFFLYPESEVSVLVRPGNYLLIGRSEVTFASGQFWRSPYNVIPLEAPGAPSFMTLTLKTRVLGQN